MKSEQFLNHSMVVGKQLRRQWKGNVGRSVSRTTFDVFLDLIYTYENGEITGDLAMFLGDNANSEVVTFIQQNLLNPQTPVGYSQLSDAEQLAMQRHYGEEPADYAERMITYMHQQNKE